MKITIVYDNEVKQPGLKADWGFSSLIETQDAPPILFDTGADGSILLHNLSQLKIAPSATKKHSFFFSKWRRLRSVNNLTKWLYNLMSCWLS